ncbi:pirin family protein [Dokdonella sp.]|uniref:pirin family protein n=1 Tax=Dokdonella sp. TaxID=2291710 RepID=UPI0031C92843|nr:pirin family protein [Dokdonella sp.]
MTTLVRERMKGQEHDLGGGLMIRRVLPQPSGHAIGPFVFMDHLGPLTLAATQAMDVRPHPHIGLATVTYLWEGRIEHKDALGNTQIIEPGAVNWMTAGRGIVHSERTAAADRGRGQTLHGLQLWVALPLEHERGAPSFEHTAATALPQLSVDGASVRVVAGTAYGARSPVATLSKLFYVDAHVPRGKTLRVPDEHVQRAAYLVEGGMQADGEPLQPGELMVFEPGAQVTLRAGADSHVVLLGGAPLDAPRYLWWNYVASSEALLAEARQAWREQRYAMVEGDPEFIPLPGDDRKAVRFEAG